MQKEYVVRALSIVQFFIFTTNISAQGLFGGLLDFGNGNNGKRRNDGGDNREENGGMLNRRNGGVYLNLNPLLPINLNLNLGRRNNDNQEKSLQPDPVCTGKQCSFTYPSKLQELGLEWDLAAIDGRVNNSGIQLRSDYNQQNYFHYFGQGQPNKDYGNCRRPGNKPGQCRHLEYCIQDVFRYDFIVFLTYSCTIDSTYIGVCCPITKEYITTTTHVPITERTVRPRPNKPRNPNRKKPKPSRDPIVNLSDLDYEISETTNKNRSCGVSEKQVTRIVGGRKADPQAWPWMAAILRKDTSGDDIRAGQYCGGVLISEFEILTASHCVDGFSPNEIRIRLGEYNFNSTSDKRRDFDVMKITLHKEYNRYSYKNDIALIRLVKSAYYTSAVKSICLPRPKRNSDFTNEVGIVTGWGTIYYGGPHSDTLMEVLVPVWKQEDCQAAYTQTIDETNLCAGVRAGSRDSCQGDSGGPLQLEIDGYWSVIAIVSWGIRCSEPGYPGVYTRVTKYMDWIHQNMAET